MRALTAILALLGCPWVFLGLWGAVMMIAYPPESRVDALHWSFTVALFLLGYLVWWGWVFYSFKRRFPIVSEKTFWIVSLAQHVISLLYLSTMDARDNPDAPLIFLLWIGGNALIAAIVLVRKPWDQPQAEQD